MKNIEQGDIKVRALEPGEESGWDTYVRNHPGALPYHLLAWKNAIADAYGHRSRYLVAKDGNGSVHGVLPLIDIAPPFTAAHTVSLPFCDAAGPLVSEVDVEALLHEEALQLSSQRKVKTIEIRFSGVSDLQDDDSGQVVHDRGESENSSVERRSADKDIKVRMLLDLPKDVDTLWKSYKSKLRSQVNKARKNGLDFCAGNSVELVEEFYQVYAENMHRLGSPAHSLKFFQSIAQRYGEEAVLGIVSHEGRPIGAGILLFIGPRVSIPWASTLSEFNRLAPNMLLYWQLIELSIQRGAVLFDFGRSTPGEGTYKFKQQWGAEPKPLRWVRSVVASQEGKAVWQTDNQSVQSGKKSAGRELAENVWRKMPISVCNFLGPRLRKYISL